MHIKKEGRGREITNMQAFRSEEFKRYRKKHFTSEKNQKLALI